MQQQLDRTSEERACNVMHAKYEKSPRNTPLHLLTRGKQIKSLDCDTDPLNLSTERSYVPSISHYGRSIAFTRTNSLTISLKATAATATDVTIEMGVHMWQETPPPGDGGGSHAALVHSIRLTPRRTTNPSRTYIRTHTAQRLSRRVDSANVSVTVRPLAARDSRPPQV
ncbi:unnamed protein product [Ceratitis capitata]|uniref:(Mediterranean fruit fly) hypothetical protein n=1 Tax=Ceratitis capitata TaxID=7213 RepID=A0A811UAA9_CERCA|nr:unnamed protein product [Ceratitis capitata]